MQVAHKRRLILSLGVGPIGPHDAARESDPEDEWEVEEVKDCQKIKGEIHYLVKWTGWPAEYNQWVPEEDMANTAKLIKKYHVEQAKKEGKKPSAARKTAVTRETSTTKETSTIKGTSATKEIRAITQSNPAAKSTRRSKRLTIK